MPSSTIPGLLSKPKLLSSGSTYKGRFTAHDVQWTDDGPDSLVTFTITAQELADAAESKLIWTDQDVQRGIRPDVKCVPKRELAIGDGYPDPDAYIFDGANADDIAEKLLRGEKLFLGPLIWNLRPQQFEAYWNKQEKELYIYSGKIFLPDSHHRQQGILKAVRTHADAPQDFPKFSPDRQFKMELYFLSKQDEGNYFFDKNQRPKPTAKSKAYDLTTQDDLSILAKRVVDLSGALSNNVNRVTDRLTAKNAQVITLSTLREMMKTLASTDVIDETEIDGLATVASTFYDMLAEVRPELGHLDVPSRRKVRETLIVDAAVIMHGYASVARDFNELIAAKGLNKAKDEMAKRLAKLSSARTYKFGRWQGDFFDKRNPLWQRVGVVKRGRDGAKLTVLNTGSARSECGRVLRQFTSLGSAVSDLQFLGKA
jgi:hypothetical protein